MSASGGTVAARARLSEQFRVIAFFVITISKRQADTSHDLLNKDICMCAFNIFDSDGDGKITNGDLRKVLNKGSLARDIAGRRDALVKDVARNGDGTIDYEPGSILAPTVQASAMQWARH